MKADLLDRWQRCQALLYHASTILVSPRRGPMYRDGVERLATGGLLEMGESDYVCIYFTLFLFFY